VALPRPRGLPAIAEAVLQTPAEDLARITRLDLAESALHAPAATFGGVEFYPDLASKTAV
jgi:death on curing protein